MNEADRSQVSQEEKQRRNPSFGRAEIKALLNLVEKYKSIIQSKTVTSAVNQLKDKVWDRITKVYNKQGFENVRNCECLKTKWENIKRLAKKSTNNIYDTENDDLNKQVASILAYTEDNPEMNKELLETEDEEIDAVSVLVHSLPWNRYKHTSANFSPRECTLLLKFVRREKAHLFLKPTSAATIRLRNRAWNRLTNAYNKLSPQKRTMKALRDKLLNMKKMSKGINFKNYFRHERSRLHKEDTYKVIKSEPLCEYKEVSYMENDNIDDDHAFDNKKDDEHDDTFEDDPLSTVLSSDSGVGKILLIIDLYLQRKRVEDQIKSDIAHREAKQIETALRIRAARLEATAAALKLPPGHAALQFTSEEAPAHLYLGGYHFT
ncbi:hypothetical protein K1T71_006023 [Dendrolimus kikuchii]|uniref:Uncharacterized protein n=1 Tax=Dendrolimus kikuchii TaxID=765133 RepID=A0ACC1D2U5_9NEOP|nr:hypothetical protein K1T71_006023 [Dendrolimus kikuchii]